MFLFQSIDLTCILFLMKVQEIVKNLSLVLSPSVWRKQTVPKCNCN